jgi:hypothetical protein
LRAGVSLFIALACLASAGTAHAAGGYPADWYVQIDNDVVFGTDRWYTSGVRIARVSDNIEFGLVQDIYTPDVKHGPPGAPDRAPTARLLASVAQHFRGVSAYQTVEAAVGVRGPAALGRQSTELVHRIIPAPEVDWTRQLKNEYDAQVVWARTQRSDAASPLGEGLKLHFGTVLGNQMLIAHMGVEYRIGSPGARGLSSPLLRFAPTPPVTDSGAPAQGWSAFVGASLRGVGRNELLAQDYDPTKPELTVKRGIGRIAAGVTYSEKWGSVSFSLAQDTREFKGQHAPHSFGALTLHLTF